MDRNDIIYGKNPVIEAIKSGQEINKILISTNEKDQIVALARKNKIVVQNVEKRKLDKIAGNNNHQGVVAYISPYSYASIEEILEVAKEKNESPLVLVLDEITDDNNLAAIIRSAHVFGAHGVIVQNRRSSALNAIVAKRSAGALAYVKVARVTNIQRTLKELKDKGFWIYGADLDESSYVDKTEISGSIALVIGSEGSGMKRLTREQCDFIITIPMVGKVSSLNAANAASVILYEVLRQKRQKE